MAELLSGEELVALVKRVFIPQAHEKALAILVDLPDAKTPDNPDWVDRREIAKAWVEALTAHREELGMNAHLVLYPNVHTNNGDLPERCWFHDGGALPTTAEGLDPAGSMTFTDLYAAHPILIAPTEFSATAPLKMAAKKFPIRAATMPGFRQDMIPALRLNYTEVNRRVELLNTPK